MNLLAICLFIVAALQVMGFFRVQAVLAKAPRRTTNSADVTGYVVGIALQLFMITVTVLAALAISGVLR